MEYKPLNLCAPEERGDDSYSWFSAEPGKIYPATIARIKEVLESGELPAELVDYNAPAEVDPRAAARLHLGEAKGVKPAAWESALTGKPGDPARAEALEVARRWFTQALHVAVNKPLGLHILNDPAYKL